MWSVYVSFIWCGYCVDSCRDIPIKFARVCVAYVCVCLFFRKILQLTVVWILKFCKTFVTYKTAPR